MPGELKCSPLLSVALCRYDHQTRLLPYVLNAIADDAKVSRTIDCVDTLSTRGTKKLEVSSSLSTTACLFVVYFQVVSAIALEALSKCGAEYECEHQSDIIERRQFGVDGDIRANHNKPLPRPFTGRPRIGARLYVRRNTRRFLLVRRN